MSSETKWTPGPWLYGEDGFNLGNGVVYVRPVGGGLRDVATVRGYGDEQKANAAFIASAPKLYEALAALTDWHEWSLEQSERAAGEFKRETGFLAPFKDSPPDEWIDRIEQAYAWRDWCAKKKAALIAAARTVLASARGEG